MADTGSAGELKSASTNRGPSRAPNLSGGWIAMVLSGLLAFVFFFFASQQTSQRVAVATFSQDLVAGQAVTADSFRKTEVAADDALLGRLVRYDDRARFTGRVTSGPQKAGDLVNQGALLEPATAVGRRSMTIPVDKAHANGGDLRPGDRIDVIDPTTTSGYVARGVEVIGVQDSSDGGLGAVQTFVVMVGVDEGQAFGISQTVNKGKFDLIRTTGATPSGGPITPPTSGTGTSTSSTSTTSTTSDVGA